ncbi:hypothetical protein CsatB_026581 [Cannabis sativa]|uniref:uncharacterized protein LOC133031298 n=1 Tax=Cannabis sativa TaxID=3483 RepID=UPI0029CA3050|nr:uncharacterized protein LOC133031298 [Cannabis sativa]
MKSKFKKGSKKVKSTFFLAAYAYTVNEFEYHMRELDKIDKRLQPYLQEIGYHKWARVHSLNNRYSIMTSNIVESLNSAILAIRELPICTMLECFRGLVHPPTHTLYEVCDDGERAIVDLTWITCSCNRFQMDQIPCKHAIAVLKANNEDPYQYCSAYYMKEAMVATYGEVVYPIGSKDMWETLDEIKNWKVDPPKGRVRVGRAKKRRFKPG